VEEERRRSAEKKEKAPVFPVGTGTPTTRKDGHYKRAGDLT